MPASRHPVGAIDLGNNNGTLYVFIDESNALKVPSTPLHSDSYLHHGPYCTGRFRVKKITDSTQALFCSDCGLRLVVPLSVTTIGELNEHLFE